MAKIKLKNNADRQQITQALRHVGITVSRQLPDGTLHIFVSKKNYEQFQKWMDSIMKGGDDETDQ